MSGLSRGFVPGPFTSCVYNFATSCLLAFCGFGLQGSPPPEPFALKGQFTSARGNALGHKSAPTPRTRPVRAGYASKSGLTLFVKARNQNPFSGS